MDDTAAAIAAALDQVGPRLKRLRTDRRVTLSSLAAATGISRSTLSRLETGQRRPSLELLLPLAHAYRVPLDDLVGAPDVADPRIRLKPGRRKGRTVIPLTTQPDGMQAWKIVIPSTQSEPALRAHEGHEWLYVLSGRMRLVLGGRDVVLGPGEVAEFDTQVPHWFGSTGEQSAEVLSLFGRHGERMHLRTTSPQEHRDLLDSGSGTASAPGAAAHPSLRRSPGRPAWPSGSALSVLLVQLPGSRCAVRPPARSLGRARPPLSCRCPGNGNERCPPHAVSEPFAAQAPPDQQLLPGRPAGSTDPRLKPVEEDP